MNQNFTSYTELSVLAECETKWDHRYLRGVRSEQTVQQRRGSGVHHAVALWWDDPQLDMAGINPWPDGAPEDPEEVARVEWLLTRYEAHYGQARAAGVLRMIGHELYLEAPIPGTATVFRAWVDGLGLDQAGDMWLVERKTMDKWTRLDWLLVDPQLTLYIWAAQAIGLPVRGVIFDAIRTYRWKPEKPTLTQLAEERAAYYTNAGLLVPTKKALMDEARAMQVAHPGVDRPASESFQVEWLDRSEEHIAQALLDVQAGLQRRGALANGSRPQRSIGPGCTRCPYQLACWDELAGSSGPLLLPSIEASAPVDFS